MGLIFDDRLTFREGRLAIQEKVELEGVEVAQVKEVMTTGKTKEFFLRGVNDFLADPDAPADRQWEQIFRVVPSESHGELFPFRVPTAAGSGSHGIVFKRVGENGEIEFSKTSATHRYVPNIKYGTAISYSSEWFEDGQMNLIEMVTEDFRDSANDKMAAIHYGAIVAAVSSGASVGTAVSGATINHYINDLNADSVVMRRNRRMPTINLIAPEQEMFVRTAMSVRVGNTQAGTYGGTDTPVPTEAISRVTPLVTEHLASGTTYLIEPKKRIISTKRRDLRLGRFSDLLHDGETLVGTFRRGVLIAEGVVIRARTGVASALPTS